MLIVPFFEKLKKKYEIQQVVNPVVKEKENIEATDEKVVSKSKSARVKKETKPKAKKTAKINEIEDVL